MLDDSHGHCIGLQVTKQLLILPIDDLSVIKDLLVLVVPLLL